MDNSKLSQTIQTKLAELNALILEAKSRKLYVEINPYQAEGHPPVTITVFEVV